MVWDEEQSSISLSCRTTYFTPDKLEAYKDDNMLKGGIVYADAIHDGLNTTYGEIKTPFYGEDWTVDACEKQQSARYLKWYRLRF